MHFKSLQQFKFMKAVVRQDLIYHLLTLNDQKLLIFHSCQVCPHQGIMTNEARLQ